MRINMSRDTGNRGTRSKRSVVRTWMLLCLAVTVVLMAPLPSTAYAADGAIAWTRQFGTTADDRVTAVAADDAGNVYVAGYTQGTVEGQTSAGGLDAFVARYSPSGVRQWIRQFGSAERDQTRSLAADRDGNVYVIGDTAGVLVDEASSGEDDVFVRKYGSTGEEVWTRQFGTDGSDQGRQAAVDSHGNVYVVGFAWASTNLTLVRSYDADGVFRWSDQLQGDSGKYVAAVDSNDRLYVAAETQMGVPNDESHWNVLVQTYDESGTADWSDVFGASSEDYLVGATVDADNHLHLVGYSYGWFPGLSNQGDSDFFVREYLSSSSSTPVATSQFGTAGFDGYDIMAADARGGFYAAQSVYDWEQGSRQNLVVRYGAGGLLWAKRYGTSDRDEPIEVASGPSESVYVVGTTDGTFAAQSHSGGDDVFVSKFVRDRRAPQAPAVKAPANAASTSTLPVFPIAMSAADPLPSSGVVSYQVQYKVGTSGNWTNWKTTGASASLRGTPGRTYYVRARARDAAGNVSVWSSSSAGTVIPHDQSVASLRGVWSVRTDPRLYLGTSRSTSRKGASAQVVFRNARAISLVVSTRPMGGYGDVYLGSRLVKRIDFYSYGFGYRVVVPVVRFPAPTSGTLRLVATGARSPRSLGTAIELDGVAIRK